MVRLDFPEDEAGDEPDERYRRAAHLLSAWRSDGTLRRDPSGSVIVISLMESGKSKVRSGK